MQTLYALESVEQPSETPAAGPRRHADPARILQHHLDQTSQLFIYLLYNIAQVALYAETDAQIRSSKHLPSQDDLNVNTKIAGNDYLWQLLSEQGFQHKAEEMHCAQLADKGLIKKLYLQLARSESYKEYTGTLERTPAEEKKIISYLFNELLMKSEAFGQHLEDHFLHWDDDREMMSVLVNNYFHKPRLFNFLQLISAEKLEYARNLLQTVLDKRDYCLSLIRPRLQNWDPERIAAVDMLLMEMGICEFLYFPTIPTKVTINEYIDLAKVYSTPQSGHFVNGILDNILKDPATAQKIRKAERSGK
ncbi:transcription antitermination factor NusB [Compostibacter hankyongensis]|uniref:Transcription antitermination factor NusB n=2 Tax=Compostibacter hankyongensis TaxID=1007089 RepID=A0ABP8FQ51_9BACT